MPSSSLFEIEVEVQVWTEVGVEIGVEVKVEAGVEVEVKVEATYTNFTGGWVEKLRLELTSAKFS